MFVKQLRLSRSKLHLFGSNLEVVRQIANLKVLNISEDQRDVSAFVFFSKVDKDMEGTEKRRESGEMRISDE